MYLLELGVSVTSRLAFTIEKFLIAVANYFLKPESK
jgi:hypothetical protein